jgi:hypothetical protein
MSPSAFSRSERRRTLWLGCATLALTVISGVVVRRVAGPNAAMAMAGVYGGGSLVMAWVTSRSTEYPRWAWFGSAGIFAFAMVVAAIALPAPAQVKDWTSVAWMFPWLYLVTSLTSAPATGACSARGARGGLLILGTSIVFSSILLVASWLTR